MAVQVVVTFGHVHLDGLTVAATQGAQSAADQAAAPPAKTHGQDQKSPGKADLDCPICALIQLASTSAPSVAPPLPVPMAVGGTILEAPERSAATPAPTFAFQARGPPAV